jgi:hypothetical protein
VLPDHDAKHYTNDAAQEQPEPARPRPDLKGQDRAEDPIHHQHRGEEHRQCDDAGNGVDRGRDGDCSPPPAQIRTGPIKAYGSYLECLTAKRCCGQG